MADNKDIQALSGLAEQLERLLKIFPGELAKILTSEKQITDYAIGASKRYNDIFSSYDMITTRGNEYAESVSLMTAAIDKSHKSLGKTAENAEKVNSKVKDLEKTIKELDEISLQGLDDAVTLAQNAQSMVANLEKLIQASLTDNMDARAEAERDLFGTELDHAKALEAFRIASNTRINDQAEDGIKRLNQLNYLKSQEQGDAERRRLEYYQNRRADILRQELEYASKNAELESRQALTEISKESNTSAAGDMTAEEIRLREMYALEAELIKENEDKWEKAKLEAYAKLSDKEYREQLAKIEKASAKELADKLENLEALSKERVAKQLKEEEQRKKKEAQAKANAAAVTLITPGKSFTERKEAWEEMSKDEEGNLDKNKATSALVNAISDLAKKLDQTIDKIGESKGLVDTRLQGSNNERYLGSYWDQINRDIVSVGAFTPYFKQENFAANVKTLIDQGIAFDIEQRAFLMTIQEKIATTFEVADGTLLRLIRIQQEDSTAGRLGMESALTAFLNNMYENTEYLKNVASSVRASLGEMESLMSGADATELEYQVQKWMGSLYSVGMSDSAIQSIASTLGQIGAGQIEGLTGSGAGNLLIMAANNADLSIADILTKGIDADETNKLLGAAVEYLSELAAASADNRVVQQQLADVFGVKASDLKAAVNLTKNSSVTSIYGNNLDYNSFIGRLYQMASSMASRTSMGEMLTNIWDNANYSIASGIANNPVLYLIYKAAGALDATVGGINIPAISVMGNMVDLDTTVADLMRVGVMGASFISNIGPMLSGLTTSFSGMSMLQKMGIAGSGLSITPRGDGNYQGVLTAGESSSSAGYIGNASGSDIRSSTEQDAEDNKKQLMVEAKEEEEANQIDYINANVLKIYELLNDVAKGEKSLSVEVKGYGLTKASNSNSASGGIERLLNNSSSNSYGNGATGSSSSSFNSVFGGSGSGNGSSGGAGGGSSVSGGSGHVFNLGSWTQL